MGMRHIGRHVQIIAKFCSLIVHMVELISTRTLSVSSTLYFHTRHVHVVSRVLVARSRVVMRTMDVTITLSRMSSPSTCLAGFHLHTAAHGENYHECTFVRDG